MKKKLVWFAVMLVSLLMAFSAASAATMTMPDGLKIIDVEAFYGDKSISTVVLPSGITEIRARAFANSSLREMNLPDSLTFIAEDALPSPTQLQVTATKGTYAYEWAGAHGFLVPAPVQNDLTGQNEKITVSWKAASGGADSYTVYYGTSSSFSAATAIPGITGTSHTITALEPGTVYYTWVKTVRGGEESLPSDRKSAITYPSAPTLKDPTVTTNSITLSWDAVKGASIYRLHYSMVDDFSTAVKIDNITETSHTIENLEHSTDYYIWSTSANASGGLRTTKALKVTTAADATTPLHKNSTPSLRKVTVNWEAFAGATSYKVYYSKNTDISVATEIAGLTGTSYEILNLQAGTTYYTWVKAVTASGDSKASNMKQALTYPAAPVLKDPVVSGNTVTLSWSAVPSADSYSVRFGTSSEYKNAGGVSGITSTSYTITGMEFNTKYYIWMEAYNGSGGARTVNALEVTTGTDDRTPKQSAPVGGQEKVTVNWTAVNGAGSYNVYYGTSASFAAAKKISGVKGTSSTITGLKRGTTYYTWVTAVQGGEESVPSNRKYVITYPQVAVLKTPTVSGNSVTLTWNAATGASWYYLRYSTSSDIEQPTVTTETTKNTTFKITGLEYNTTYYIWIVSGNSSGAVRNADAVTVKTGAAP